MTNGLVHASLLVVGAATVCSAFVAPQSPSFARSQSDTQVYQLHKYIGQQIKDSTEEQPLAKSEFQGVKVMVGALRAIEELGDPEDKKPPGNFERLGNLFEGLEKASEKKTGVLNGIAIQDAHTHHHHNGVKVQAPPPLTTPVERIDGADATASADLDGDSTTSVDHPVFGASLSASGTASSSSTTTTTPSAGVVSGSRLAYATYPKHDEYPRVDLSSMMKRLDGVPPGEYWFSLRKFLRLGLRLAATSLGLWLTSDAVEKASPQEKFKAIFTPETLPFGIRNPLNLVPLPKHAYKHWNEDDEFARQFLNGVNPLMIAVVKDVQEQVTDELRNHLEEEGVNVEKLAAAKQLFVVDYEWLQNLQVNPHQAYPLATNPDKPQNEDRYFQAPQVILRLNENDREKLELLAIQLDRRPNATVYTHANTDENKWLFVKSSVANCDSQFHEWVSHLGKTHLTMEPHIIAIHNTLRQSNHKLFTFLKPMVRDTLLLNWAARDTLAKYGSDSFGDYMTSVGTGQFMQLIHRYWSSYHFFKSSALDQELESRGFDKDFDMPGYYFREDGMKLWNAYGKFASDFVDECYASDAEVAKDSILQAWAKETTDPDLAAVNGFPKRFRNKKTVAKTLQTLWWICSGLHAAVNFPQADFYGYAPNKPLGMRAGMDQYDSAKAHYNWMYEDAYPYVDNAKEAVSVASALTLPSKHTIGRLEADFATLGKVSYAKFKVDLANIEKEIDERNHKNKEKGLPAYRYLRPTVVPASIDI